MRDKARVYNTLWLTTCFDGKEEYMESRLRIGESEHFAICLHGGTTRVFPHFAACGLVPAYLSYGLERNS